MLLLLLGVLCRRLRLLVLRLHNVPTMLLVMLPGHVLRTCLEHHRRLRTEDLPAGAEANRCWWRNGLHIAAV